MPTTETVAACKDTTLPRHVAIIMDGNGRWAKLRGKFRVSGHKAGVKSVRAAVSFAHQLQLEALTLFAFSSENWRRPKDEVTALMGLFMTVLGSEVKKLHRNNIRLKVVGNWAGFSDHLQRKIAEAQQLTANNTGLVLNIAANYGGRWDITQACRQVAERVALGELTAADISEDDISNAICMNDLASVDLLIRTGGEQRISNFLLWQLAYAELHFTPVLWPDFNEAAFSDAIAAFVSRERRFGCTGEQIRALLKANSSA